MSLEYCNEEIDYEMIYKPSNSNEIIPYELLFFSKSPTIEINCEINCPPGHIIDYNPITKNIFPFLFTNNSLVQSEIC